MHTILGSGGAIANSLAVALHERQLPVRLVSRSPKRIQPTDELVSANLTDRTQTLAAVKGSTTVYLMAGLPYDAKVWARDWPVVIDNAIAACREAGAKLVFFDNVYALGLPPAGFREDSPLAPQSRKGEVRAQLVRRLTDAWTKGEVRALIARAADFYGPRVGNSFLNAMVIDPMAKGKSASVLMRDDTVHTYFYTPDAGPALVVLGTSPQADNQVWNLPHDPTPLTGRAIVEACATHLGSKPKFSVLKRWMMKPIGWFNPIIREFDEMLYQFDAPYRVDSSKIERAFGLKATPMLQGLAASLDAAREQSIS